jgi:hypothetical protein
MTLQLHGCSVRENDILKSKERPAGAVFVLPCALLLELAMVQSATGSSAGCITASSVRWNTQVLSVSRLLYKFCKHCTK